MRSLSEGELCRINRRLIARFGGLYVEKTRNILNLNSLKYLVTELAHDIEGESVPDAAGRLAYRIIDGHVFDDGNARTGMEAAFMLLELNGFEVLAEDSAIIEIGQTVSEGLMSRDEVCAWVRTICRPDPSGTA